MTTGSPSTPHPHPAVGIVAHQRHGHYRPQKHELNHTPKLSQTLPLPPNANSNANFSTVRVRGPAGRHPSTSRSASASAPLPTSSTRAGNAPTPSSSFLPQSPVVGDDVGRAQHQLRQVDINHGADHNHRLSGGASVLITWPDAGKKRSRYWAPSFSLTSRCFGLKAVVGHILVQGGHAPETHDVAGGTSTFSE
ncbi:hypothetical protein GALMADRAFT_148879 [Galerina marginata CBS 339.88]|uniref:Uncharacterized protein n=1 Tax=Galerina marginata (strain CBS 339.88) TaxID=685588 RepID=A0A067S5R0_GALM3|nr:hypothetical protein GALMADRAFT_148879 [Galerina marginata CBS 339.88]